MDKLLSEAKENFNTIRDILRFAVSLFNKNNLFYGHGTLNSYDEAIFLILFSLNLPLDKLDPFLDAKLTNLEIEKLLDLIVQRVETRKPLPYILNHSVIQNYHFYIDERAIIPRSFIAEIILNDQLSPWLKEVNNILELCTGNGSLAIIAADYYENSNVIAGDISHDALEVAKINISNYDLDDRIKIIHSDLFSKIPNLKFDLIISNPPYIGYDNMQSLPKEYLYEPEVALFGGNNGLDLINKIILNAQNYLSEDGVLIIEMGENIDELYKLWPKLNFIWLETSNNGYIFLLTKKELKNTNS